MKNAHQQYLEMCRYLLAFFRRHEDELGEIPEIANQFVKLSVLKDQFSIEFDKSISYNNLFSLQRAKNREALQGQIIQMSKHLDNLKKSIKYKKIEKLEQFFSPTELDLNRKDELELLDFSDYLYHLLLDCQARLKSSGVKQQELDDFTKTLTTFALDYPLNRHFIEIRKEASVKCLELFAELNLFVVDQLDKRFHSDLIKNKKLVQEYEAARVLRTFNIDSAPDYEGVIKDEEIHTIVRQKYELAREFRVVVDGGNAIWGLSDNKETIEFSRPVYTNDHYSIKSKLIGDYGNYLQIQSLHPEIPLHYKVWVNE